MAQGVEVQESLITKNPMEEKSKEYNARVMNAILSGLIDATKTKRNVNQQKVCGTNFKIFTQEKH